jgi:hypothetical protein
VGGVRAGFRRQREEVVVQCVEANGAHRTQDEAVTRRQMSRGGWRKQTPLDITFPRDLDL